LLLVGAVVPGGALAQSSKTVGPKYGGVLKLCVNTDAVTLGYPPQMRSWQDFIMSAPALETLCRFDPSGKLVPWLAQSWQLHPKTKTVTITLRKGVKFHDGTRFDAQAVKWNLEHFTAAGRTEIKEVKKILVVDDYTLRLVLDQWNSSIMEAITMFIPMVSPTAFKKYGKDWMVTHPVGTGPFEFVSWERDVAVKYEKFKEYWQKGKPYLDGVEWRVIRDPMTAVASFKRGEIHVYAGMTPLMAKELKDWGAEVVPLKTGLGALIAGVIGDSAHPDSPFANLKVRQAVSHAIDTKMIVNKLLYGYGILTNQWAVPGSWSYNPNVKGYPYDPKKAKQLLAEAGYPKGFKTKLTTDSSPTAVQFATAVQGYLRQVGIIAELEVLDRGKYDQLTSRLGWKGLITWTSRADADVAIVMPRNLSRAGVLYANSIIHPEKIENLLVQARTAPDFPTKVKVAQELQKAVIDEFAIMTPVYVSTMPAAKQRNVRGDGINQTHASMWTPADAWLE
jgi:ABC-type transport system substrate-binding protein